MKKYLFIIAFGLLLNKGNAQQITFEKEYGSANSMNAPLDVSLVYVDPSKPQEERISSSVLETKNSTYIKLTAEYGHTEDLDIRMAKTNKYGKILWSKVFGREGEDIGKSMQLTSDGGIVFTGSTNSFGEGGFDVQLTKTDSLGNALWTKTYGGAGNEYGESVKETADGGFIIVGRTNSSGAGNMDVYVIRTDSNGNLTWAKTIGGANEDFGTAVTETANGFCVAATTKSYGAGSYDIYLIMLDQAGDKIWEKTIGGMDAEIAETMQSAMDGGFVITGSTLSSGAGMEDLFLVHTDVNGNSTWAKTYGGMEADKGYSVKQTTDGGYIVAGETKSLGLSMDLYLIRTDSAGSLLWSRIYGGDQREVGNEVLATSDGGYAVLGTTESFTPGKIESYFVKVNASGKTLCHFNEEVSMTGDVLFSSSTPSLSLSSGSLVAGTYVMNDNEFILENTRVSCSSSAYTQEDAFNSLTEDTNFIADPNDQDSTAGNFSTAPFVSKAVIPFSSGIAMNVYPNPGAGADVKVLMHASEQEEVLVVVYDALGRENFSKVLVMEENTDNVIAIDPDGALKPGVYMITATSQKSNFSKKLIIK